MCIWLIRIFLLKGMISWTPNLQAKKSCILCLNFGESQLLGTCSCKILFLVRKHCVFLNFTPCIFFKSWIPKIPFQTLKTGVHHGGVVYSNGTYLLIQPPWHLLILACHSRWAPHPPRLIGHYQFQQMVLINSKGKGKYKMKMWLKVHPSTAKE